MHLWITALPCCANDTGGGATPVGPCHLCREPHINQYVAEPSYFLSWIETMGSVTGGGGVGGGVQLHRGQYLPNSDSSTQDKLAALGADAHVEATAAL